MIQSDLPALVAVAAVVHPNFPEDQAVLAERLRLYPQGCRMLERGGASAGYVISHPWAGDPPALNTLLRELPAPTMYYIHDLALLPEAQGRGAADAIVEELVEHARQSGLPIISLVAVNNSQGYWQRHGFQPVHDAALAHKLGSYGADACFMQVRLPT